MRVTMKCGMAGPRFTAKPGDVVEVDDATGARLVAAGAAEAFAEQPPAVFRRRRQKATARPAPERAIEP